jgi:formate hydrogenlyase subunit 6/NADH:ubiquinone oxidoreductase subunit I
MVSLLSETKRPILGCRAFTEGISTARVDCLGGLTALDLAVLATSIQVIPLRVNLAFCHLCPAGTSVVPMVRCRIDEASAVVGENRITALVDTQDVMMTRRQATRRGLLKNLLAPVAEMAQAVSMRQHEHTEPAVFAGIPERQQYALGRCGRLPASSPNWLLSKTPRCDECCHCVGVCPTGALSRKRRHGERAFGIDTQRCTGCRACLDFCPKGGLALSRATPACQGGRRRTMKETQQVIT